MANQRTTFCKTCGWAYRDHDADGDCPDTDPVGCRESDDPHGYHYGPPEGERDQLDYAWNEPGAPFRSGDY